MTTPIAKSNGEVNRMINGVETITYYKHHYVRKTGLKKKIKQQITSAKLTLLKSLLGEPGETIPYHGDIVAFGDGIVYMRKIIESEIKELEKDG